MLPSNSKNWSYENEACVRCFLQIPLVEDVKTKLSCDASFKLETRKLWKRSFRAMLPSNFKSWRCDHMSSTPMQKVCQHMQNTIAQQHQRKAKITLNHQFHCARSSRYARRRPQPSRTRAYFSPHPELRLPEKTQCFVQILTFKWHPWCIKTLLSCDASVKFQELKLRKRSLRAMLPSNSTSWRCENEAFVRCFLQIGNAKAVKTKLACDASFKFH